MVRGAHLVGAALLLAPMLVLSSCDQKGAGKSPDAEAAQPAQQAIPQRVQAALDPCASTQAQNSFAQNVCANRSLSTLDGEIRTALASEASNMSEAGARLLISGQQGWRDAQRVSCGIANAAPTAEQQTCLEQRFRARAAEAATVVESVGGYTFQRVEAVRAAPTPQRFAAMGGEPATTVDIRYPRIDGPNTPQIQRFNALMQQNPQFDPTEGTNETVRYSIAYAGPDLVSVRFDSSDDTPGAAQVNSNVKAVTVVMSTGRALTAEDVFKAGSGWENFITRRAIRDLARQYREYDNFTPPERDVHETATKPHLWLVTEQALVLLFPPLSFGGSYDMASAEVSIPWADLRQYLNPNAPAPIRPQA